jgi:hypothetical protein
MAITKTASTQMRAIVVGLSPEDCCMGLLVALAVAGIVGLGSPCIVSIFCYESILGRFALVGLGIWIAIA